MPKSRRLLFLSKKENKRKIFTSGQLKKTATEIEKYDIELLNMIH
jgi:hypothetical protein